MSWTSIQYTSCRRIPHELTTPGVTLQVTTIKTTLRTIPFFLFFHINKAVVDWGVRINIKYITRGINHKMDVNPVHDCMMINVSRVPNYLMNKLDSVTNEVTNPDVLWC